MGSTRKCSSTIVLCNTSLFRIRWRKELFLFETKELKYLIKKISRAHSLKVNPLKSAAFEFGSQKCFGLNNIKTEKGDTEIGVVNES